VVAARVAVAGHGHVASFIVVGAAHVRSRVPTGIPVTSGQGYDGQFYYRMALAPLNFHRTAFGIQLDTVSRFERIGYPALAWLGAGGHEQFVPWSLVVVNVIGLVSLGALGAVIARGAGRHSCWGLLLPGYFGFIWVLSRDLSEIVTATFVVAGVVALRRNRYVLAGAAFSVAVLSRETSLVVIVLLALENPLLSIGRWLGAKRLRSPLSIEATPPAGGITPAISWLLPGVVFVVWQLVARSATDIWPLFSSGQHNVGTPFGGVVQGLRHYFDQLPSTASMLWFGELLVLAVVVIAAARSLRTTTARLYERAAWLVYGLVALTLAPGVWLGDVGFRSLDDLYVFSGIVLLSSRQRLSVPALLIAGSWVAVAIELIRFI
jgi:hypothetical protein